MPLMAGIIFLAAFVPMNPFPAPSPLPGPPPYLVAAPLFLRGAGRGVLGPQISPAPVFLSKEEGVKLIKEELARFRLTVEEENLQVESSLFHLFRPEGAEREWRVEVEPGDTAEILEVDGICREHFFAFEFLSREDYEKGSGGGEREAPGRVFDFPAAGAYLAATVSGQPIRFYFGIFYDPLCDPVSEELSALHYKCDAPDYAGDRLKCVAEYYAQERAAFARWDGREEEIRECSRQRLRLQVRDFIAWLKQNGALPLER